jgi:hypothetical protein
MACTIAVVRRGSSGVAVGASGLSGSRGAFAEGADTGVRSVDVLLCAGQSRPVPVAFELGADGAACAFGGACFPGGGDG